MIARQKTAMLLVFIISLTAGLCGCSNDMDSSGSNTASSQNTDSKPLANPQSQLYMVLPGEPWCLVMDGSGFEPIEYRLSPDAQTLYYYGENRSEGLMLSLTLTRDHAPGDNLDCRQDNWNHLLTAEPPEENMRQWESGSKAMLSYRITSYEGIDVEQQHQHAFMEQNGVWISVHVSKPAFQSSDQAIFDRLLASAEVQAPYQALAIDYTDWGNSLLYQEFYEQSIVYLARALDMEKSHRTLGQDDWRILVDNLGMAYGIAGQYDLSQATLEYGIKEEPEYPNFYYNLACLYAEKGNTELALENMRRAYQYKNNRIIGEEFPDARNDQSFAAMMADPALASQIEKIVTTEVSVHP